MNSAPSTKRRISRVAWVFLLAGLVVVVASGARMAFAAYGVVSQPSFTVPGRTSLTLDPGVYAIYEQAGSVSQAGPVTFSRTNRPSISVDDVTVTGPNGQQVRVMPVSGVETLQVGDDIYIALTEFEANQAGTYTVAVGTGVRPGSAVVSRELADLVKSLVGWIALAVLGALVLFGGLVGVVVSAVRSNRRKDAGPPAPHSGPPQPGAPPWSAPGPAAGPPPVPPSWGPPAQPAQPPSWDPPARPPSGPPSWGPPS